MEKSNLIWLNGEFVNWEDANISVMSHTLHYGTGVFEGIRARDSKIGTTIFRLPDHVDRLFDSAEAYNLKIPYDKEVIINVIKDSVHLNNLSSAYIRPLVFFGEGEMGLLPKSVPVYVSVEANDGAEAQNSAEDVISEDQLPWTIFTQANDIIVERK